MARTIGVTQILNKKYKMLDVSDKWKNVFGQLPDPFSMIVIGKPKNGKTSLVMSFCRDRAERYKVFYSSLEEGDAKTIQDALILADMKDVAGKFFIGEDYFFNDLVEKLSKPRSPKIVVIDSLDYMSLTTSQWKELIYLFPKKSWMIICWGSAHPTDFANPDNYYAKQIKYKVGTVVLVKDFKVTTRGRYGMTDPYTIWDKKSKPQAGDQLEIQ